MMHLDMSCDSQCSRFLLMNATIESVVWGCERNVCRDWFWLRNVESISKFGQRPNIVTKYDTRIPELVQGKICIIDKSHHLRPNALSYNEGYGS